MVGRKSSQGLILKTTNSGASWTPQTIGTSSSFYGVCFLNEMNGWVVGNGGTILHTANGGNNWEIQSSNVTSNLDEVVFFDQNHGWAIGDNRTVLRTTDGGNNWILSAFSDNAYVYSIYFLDEKIGWLGTDIGLYKSVDGGDKWTKVTLPSDFYDNIDAIYFTSENLGWFMANSGGWSSYSQIYKTENGGTTWKTELSASKQLYDFCFYRWDHDWADAWAVGVNSMIAYGAQLFTRIQILNEKSIPTNFELYQNYPNPFNSKTVIEYDLPQIAKVKLTIYDVLGREVKTIVEELQHPGKHRVELDTQNWGSGTFFYKIQANEFTRVNKLIHLK